MSDGVRGAGVRAGCLGSGFGRPWVLVVAMLAPVVLGGGLLVVSLAGVEVGGRQVGDGGPRAGVLRAQSEGGRAVSGPEVVYERVVEARVRRGGEVKWRQGAGESREVPEGRRGRESWGARKKEGKGRSVGWVDGKKGRPGEECPPEEAGGVRDGGGGAEVEGERDVISELWVGVVGTEAE